MRVHWFAFVAALVSSGGGSLSSAQEASRPVTDHGVLEWIHNSEGGYIHPDQELRVDPEIGSLGIFATKFIPKGTVLCQVPWSIVIKSDDPEEEGQMCCGTVKSVAREMKKGNESEFGPYVEYLNAQPNDDIPSAWSDMGQELFRAIAGGKVEDTLIPPEEPTEWLIYDWYGRCRGSRVDKLAAKAAMLVVQRSDDAIMIPGYDMYNHRNGKYLNTEVTTYEGEKHVTAAARDIQPGEQIHNSYNRCKECSGRRIGYGTAEILRDYGFVEAFPQIWHYQGDMQFELDVNEHGGFDLKWMYKKIPNNDDRPGAIVWFRRQIRRLRQVRNVNYKDGNPGMPEHEWKTAWEFQRANIQAMTVAAASLEAIEAGKTDDKEMAELQSSILVSDFDEDMPHYDKLDWEFDDLEYVNPTCNNRKIMKFLDHVVVEELKTHYQRLNFAIHPDTMDVVMDLDNIVQISSNYRPQYHEYVTHAAARFVKDIKRVIFIGGGDSMLLHETLKYPDLELVVGLELDQMVTRKCFKYFRSSPHFEDPRVEWWFGDATKSLLLLSKEYWQSFDLVLVDLSETVMSLSVTSELDVFDALALLLKHDGVMVKNELYMEPFSKVFDYTMDILYESPVICSQVLAFGSNKVDFMHDEVYDHGIETFLYKNMHDPDTRHNFTHDYRINNATKLGKCGSLPKIEKLEEQIKSAGIVEIVEAEKVTVTLDESLGEVFTHVIEREGFRPLAAPVYESGMMMIVMKEGYVMTRMWPGEKYCNLDVNLWGKFHKLHDLRQSLTDAMGSELVSRFRIVVGGMYGSDTWTEDRDIIGPQIVQTRNCDIPTHGDAPDVSEELITAAFDRSIGLVNGEEITAIVVCEDTEDCLATRLVSKHNTVRKIVKLKACKRLRESPDSVDSRYACEVDLTLEIKQKLANDKADLVVVDSSASYQLVQILNSILSRDEYRKDIIREENVFMAWTMNAEEEEHQRFFLDRYRKQHEWDPMARAEIWMQDGKKALEFGVLSAGDKKIVYKIDEIETSLKKSFKGKENIKIELRGIYGGLYEFKDVWEPQEFLQSDYDTDAGYDHYFGQKPLARHTVFQLEEKENMSFDFNKDSLNHALAKALEAVAFECTTRYSYVGVGEGVVMLCMNPYKGSTVLVWDGRKHVDISYYLMGDEEGEPERFMGAFLHHVGRKLTVALRDEMPRGTGRVINFAGDLRTREELKDFYENLESYEFNSKAKPEAGGDDEEDDDDDENENDEEEDATVPDMYAFDVKDPAKAEL